MTPMQVARAYNAILTTNLTKIPMSYHDARALTQLKSALEVEYKTVLRLEQEMVARYSGKYTPQGYDFPNPQLAEAFRAEHGVMMRSDEPMELPALDLSAYADRLEITAEAVEALDGVVTFERDSTATNNNMEESEAVAANG